VNARNARDARLVVPIAPCNSRPMAIGPNSVQLHAKVSAKRAPKESGAAPASASALRRKLPNVHTNPSTHSSR
jgi:hypothetical protein